jgi:hypothetical protein
MFISYRTLKFVIHVYGYENKHGHGHVQSVAFIKKYKIVHH